MPELPPYQVLLSELLLPDQIRELVEPPFMDLGYPLTKDSTEDLQDNTLEYFRAKANGRQIVLLHIAGNIIGDPANFRDVASIAYVFITKSAGLFFFAPIKDLNREYNLSLATRLQENYPNIKKIRFFDQQDIETLANKPPAARKKLVSGLLDLNTLLPSGNGPPASAAPPDIARVQNRLIQIVVDYARTLTLNRLVTDIFLELRLLLDWPGGWTWEPKGSIDDCANSLIKYLISLKVYPPGVDKDGYTTVGFLLYKLIGKAPGDQPREIYKIIVDYKLITRQEALDEVRGIAEGTP